MSAVELPPHATLAVGPGVARRAAANSRVAQRPLLAAGGTLSPRGRVERSAAWREPSDCRSDAPVMSGARGRSSRARGTLVGRVRRAARRRLCWAPRRTRARADRPTDFVRAHLRCRRGKTTAAAQPLSRRRSSGPASVLLPRQKCVSRSRRFLGSRRANDARRRFSARTPTRPLRSAGSQRADCAIGCRSRAGVVADGGAAAGAARSDRDPSERPRDPHARAFPQMRYSSRAKSIRLQRPPAAGRLGRGHSPVKDLRREYASRSLDEATHRPDPIAQFRIWFQEAADAQVSRRQRHEPGHGVSFRRAGRAHGAAEGCR